MTDIASLLCLAAIVMTSCVGNEGSEVELITAEQRAKFFASDAQSDAWIGASVSISGDCAIVGACRQDGGAGNPLTDVGSVYLYD